jgi:hypothetical protein
MLQRLRPGVAHAAVAAERDLWPKASSDEQHKLLPCGWPAGEPMLP